jgi:hypothetical protein
LDTLLDNVLRNAITNQYAATSPAAPARQSMQAWFIGTAARSTPRCLLPPLPEVQSAELLFSSGVLFRSPFLGSSLGVLFRRPGLQPRREKPEKNGL